MKRSLVLTVPLCALTACGNPLDSFAKLSDVELAETEQARGVLASPEEVDRDEPVLTSLLTQNSNSETTTQQEPKRPGLLARLRGRASSDRPVAGDEKEASLNPLKISDESTGDSVPVPLSVPTQTDQPVLEASVAVPSSADGVAANDTLVAAKEPTKRPKLLGFLRRNTPKQDASPQENVQLAALAIDDPVAKQSEPRAKTRVPALDAEAPKVVPKRRGLFGAGTNRSPKRTGPDAQDVAAGTIVPYGEVARVCDVKSPDLGKKIEKAGSGRGYALYDSVPGSTSPRTFYVTGFADGCARQFTAALALFGAPSLHEQLRYGKPADQYPYSTTDKAYELVKSSVCRVTKRKPCGTKINQLEKDTVFISTYERFTDNGRWADILVHDGRVLAAAIKDL